MRDADVRAALLRELTTHYQQHDPSTLIVQEMGIWSGTVRIDVAAINGRLTGFEIKSDRDTLGRLPYQAQIYSHVFDRLILVTGRKHIKKAAAIIPKWWSILGAVEGRSGIELRIEREGKENPKIDPLLLAQLLWKDEALGVLDKYDLARGYRSKRAPLIYARVANELPLATLRDEVRAVLKARAQWLGKPVGDEGQMAIHTQTDPGSAAS